jgi:hypothetical protein
VTICQVRDAANTLLDVLPLSSPEDRRRRLARRALILRQRQQANAASRRSHAKRRQKELRAIGIRVTTLRCCIPP